MYLNGEDVSSAIRMPEISICASDVSAHAGVRAYLLEMQRKMARENNVIMDGRDIGTVVLPKANVKIFLTASAEVRAQRRLDELLAKGEKSITFQSILADIKERDHRDMTRPVAPLKQAEDAVLLDTSDLTIEESVAAIKDVIEKRLKVC